VVTANNKSIKLSFHQRGIRFCTDRCTT